MKKLLFLAAFVLAIGSYGGHTLAAHAQTATDTTMVATSTDNSTATLEQELAVAKATLANLQMQAGAIPAGDTGTPTSVVTPVVTAQPTAGNGLTSSEVSSFENTLNTLVASLTQLNNSLASNATMTADQQQAVQSTLNGMTNTLVAMANTITSDIAANNAGTNSAPIAAAPSATPTPTQSTGVAQNTTPSTPATAPTVVAQTTPVTPTTPTVTPVTSAPQTAQASSFWSFTKSHWPTIAIIILILAILVILFWPEKEVATTISTHSKPTQSTVTVTQTTTSTNPAGTSPVSTVVGTSHTVDHA